ncbi:MarR family transcriptional regulator [Caulobacter segnis]|uniref:MarR family winged helix-turn-helix transcriptional regulator n=1 Tax=Caulobacter segnis TaxID=88688 RepID=UPI00240F3F82|nr:MarR family transcriptional regulator [Caulobacter segnis]MDG2523643.1 MarR family transcriptional regulator [Caulobacter segnis]
MTARSDDPSGYTTKAGAAAIGARLRRLSERIDRDAARLYAESGVAFEQRWFGVVNLLSLYETLTVGELAAALGVSHATVSQVRAGLETAKLIAWDADKTNPRQRRLRLTPAGRDVAARLAPLWAALSETAVELNDEAQDALAALDRLEQATLRLSLYDRVKARLAQD